MLFYKKVVVVITSSLTLYIGTVDKIPQKSVAGGGGATSRHPCQSLCF